jgi:hypothetical protein
MVLFLVSANEIRQSTLASTPARVVFKARVTDRSALTLLFFYVESKRKLAVDIIVLGYLPLLASASFDGDIFTIDGVFGAQYIGDHLN